MVTAQAPVADPRHSALPMNQPGETPSTPALEVPSPTALRILAVTNMYPTEESPAAGIFVQQQVEGLRRIGLDVEVLFVDRLSKGAAVYATMIRDLRSAIASFRPHLVHVMYGGIMAERVTSHIRDRPVVVTYHGSDLLGSRAAGLARRGMARYGVWASRLAARRACGVIAVAHHLKQHLPREVEAGSLRVIPCGIDLQRFQPMDGDACRRRLGWDPEIFHVLFATGNDDPVKRPELARAAVGELRRRGVNARLDVLRGVAYDEVPMWLNASHALLLTSLTEGSPTIVKEALACDRPVVSVAVGDVVEQVQGITGCHIVEAAPGALAAALERVHQRREPIAGRTRMVEQSLERTAERVHDFYGEVLCRFRRMAEA